MSSAVREFLLSGAGKEEKRSSWIVILAVVIVAFLILGAVAELMVQIGKNEERCPSDVPVKTSSGTLHTTHSPISIIGNAGFTNASGVIWGSGTASDPYIIADWDINASTATGISILGTDAHLIIRDCYAHGSSFYYGIILEDCVNGILENNDCSNDYLGIDLISSSNSTLSGNICNANVDDGISLDHASDNNTLTNNNCSSNYNYGIYLYSSSDNNALNDNNCSSNSWSGVVLDLSSNNNLTNNNCSSNHNVGMFLISSNNDTVVNNECSKNMDGIALYLSNDSTISNNNCSDNLDGIVLSFLNGAVSNCNNVIFQNSICNNTWYGTYIDSGYNNRIWNNTFIDNNGAGSTYSSGHAQAYDDGTNNRWNNSIGFGNWWSDWTTPDANHDSIVDQPYAIDGSAGVQDHYPLTTAQTQIPEFGIMPLVVVALLAVSVVMVETRRKKT